MKYLKKFETHEDYEEYLTGGTIVKPNVSYCEDFDDVHYNPYVHDYSQDYFTTVALENGTITFTPINSNVISYSTDNGNTWTAGNSVTVESGDEVLWKGTMTPLQYEGIGNFSSTCNFDVQGNIMSLLFGDDFKNQLSLEGKNYSFPELFYGLTKIINAENLSLLATTLADYCYRGMFGGCISLITAPQLPATTLTESCYQGMFEGCTNLTTAPQLPATTLADSCYNGMFNGCTSLTSAPELPATTLTDWCYGRMFRGCTSLTSAPELPATTLAEGCYNNMFYGCTSLTTAPELPATTLADSCYQFMFYNCTSLTSAPELPATTLVSSCYYYMFSNCTSLTSAPQLLATTLAQSCYGYMFRGCTNLNYIKAMFTTTPSSTYTYNWVSGVAANGTFVKNSAATWTTTGVNGVPTGWTVQTASA